MSTLDRDRLLYKGKKVKGRILI